MLERIDHIDFTLEDVASAVETFKKLGFSVLFERGKPGDADYSAEVVLPGENQVVIELRPAIPNGGVVGLNHVSFKVSGPDTVDKMKDLGFKFEPENKFIQDSERTISNFRAQGLKWQLTDGLGLRKTR